MRRFALMLAVLGFAAIGRAEPAPVIDAAPGAGPPHATPFVAPDAIDLAQLLPAPPAPDSLVQRAELEVLYHLQQERTPAQVERARKVDGENFFVFGADVLGPWFNAADLPQAAAFSHALDGDFHLISHAAKKLFNRRRPPYLDARIKPCVKYGPSPAYPSGHSLRSAVWAALLSEAFPEHAAALQARAAETRWCRLLAGVHSPTDTEAGRIAGEALARELLKQPAVRQALQEIRAEAAPFLLRKAA